MAECQTCHHDVTLHTTPHGRCHVEGCACDECKYSFSPPHTRPPKPGACLHILGSGHIWVFEEFGEVSERLDLASEFVELTGCEWEGSDMGTYPMRIRPQAIMGFHEVTDRRWSEITGS